ncbi:MAG TPA: hypothetical protein VGB02_14420 [Pyrinomonadaceae bacterium]|jgi:ABC-type multidrug transport system fused ATPase/permease subunit
MSNSQNVQLSWQQIFIVITTLILILVFLVLVLWLVFYGVSSLASRELTPILPTLGIGLAAIITASATIFAAIRTKSIERLKEIEQELRKQKAPIYEEFADFLLNKVLQNKASSEEMLEFVMKFHQKMIVWGDDKVIKAWVDFRKEIDTPTNKYHGLFQIENVLFKIRADMGHSNKGLEKGDLLRLFINDMDKVFEKENNSLK